MYGNAFLLHPWPDRLYLFPPLPLLARVVTRLTTTSSAFILIAPDPSEGLYLSWYPILLSLITHHPLPLGSTFSTCLMADKSRTTVPGHLAAYARF
jgi:hypothetical protein